MHDEATQSSRIGPGSEQDDAPALISELKDNLPLGVVLTEREPYRVVWASHATADILGVPYAEIFAGPEAWLRRVDPESTDRVRRFIDVIRREAAAIELEYITHPDEGEPRRIHVRSEPLFAADGAYVRRLAVVSAGAAAHATHEHTTRVAFLAELSHEMRTPLSSMLGFAEMLADSELDARQRRWATLLQESGGLLVELLETALYLARLEDPSGALRRERFVVNPVVRRCIDLVEPLALARGITLRTEEADEKVVALGDHERLQQVLLNILTNALKYGPEASEVVVRTAVDDRTLSVDVHDTGPGIEKGQRDRIFEPFERLDSSRAAAGSGLGLCVSRALMKAMGGSLGVVDTKHPGATFRIGLPVAPDCLRFEAVPRTTDGHDRG